VSLLDDLKKVAAVVDPQFQVSDQEIRGVLSALVYFTEHGDKLLQAADKGLTEVTSLLAPPAAEPVTPPAAPADVTAPAAPTTDAELEAQITDLQTQLAARQATAQQTVSVHEPGVPADTPPEPA
jgi:hypothetical protein